jgi:hypothetical protein
VIASGRNMRARELAVTLPARGRPSRFHAAFCEARQRHLEELAPTAVE